MNSLQIYCVKVFSNSLSITGPQFSTQCLVPSAILPLSSQHCQNVKLSCFFSSFGNRKKSQEAMSGEYWDWNFITVSFLAKYSRASSASPNLLSWHSKKNWDKFCCHQFHTQNMRKNCLIWVKWCSKLPPSKLFDNDSAIGHYHF